MTDLHLMDVASLRDAYRQRALSPVEVTEAVLARIDRWEPHLHALYAPDPARSRAMAGDSEARWRAGLPLSPLDGIPCTLKENIATRGDPSPLGTAASDLTPAMHDAPPAQRLREAGCVLLGKTTMPDYGMLSSGLSSFHPLARNPWNLAMNPGGSSAGAAAAAAAGYGPLHVGTDIGGSVRLPAAWCGLVGLKPSAGRIPIYPTYAGRVAGPITRTVGDAACMMEVLSRPDDRDTTRLPWQPLDWMSIGSAATDDAVLAGLRGLRVGWLPTAGWGMAVEPPVHAAVELAARRFEQAGAVVEEMAAFSTRAMADGMDRFWRMRSWLDITALPEERRRRVLPYILQWAEGGAGLSAREVFEGYSQMAALREAAVGACHAYDFVLSPVSPVAAFPADWASPLNDPSRPFEHIAFTLPFNMSEQPALSIDAGRTEAGMPIGLQIIGRRHDDLGVLRAARAWELLRAAPPAWPEPPPGEAVA